MLIEYFFFVFLRIYVFSLIEAAVTFSRYAIRVIWLKIPKKRVKVPTSTLKMKEDHTRLINR